MEYNILEEVKLSKVTDKNEFAALGNAISDENIVIKEGKVHPFKYNFNNGSEEGFIYNKDRVSYCKEAEEVIGENNAIIKNSLLAEEVTSDSSMVILDAVAKHTQSKNSIVATKHIHNTDMKKAFDADSVKAKFDRLFHKQNISIKNAESSTPYEQLSLGQWDAIVEEEYTQYIMDFASVNLEDLISIKQWNGANGFTREKLHFALNSFENMSDHLSGTSSNFNLRSGSVERGSYDRISKLWNHYENTQKAVKIENSYFEQMRMEQANYKARDLYKEQLSTTLMMLEIEIKQFFLGNNGLLNSDVSMLKKYSNNSSNPFYDTTSTGVLNPFKIGSGFNFIQALEIFTRKILLFAANNNIIANTLAVSPQTMLVLKMIPVNETTGSATGAIGGMTMYDLLSKYLFVETLPTLDATLHGDPNYENQDLIALYKKEDLKAYITSPVSLIQPVVNQNLQRTTYATWSGTKLKNVRKYDVADTTYNTGYIIPLPTLQS